MTTDPLLDGLIGFLAAWGALTLLPLVAFAVGWMACCGWQAARRAFGESGRTW